MTIWRLATLAMFAAVWAIDATQLQAQTTELSSLTDQPSSDRRGRFESVQGEQEMVGPNIDNVRDVIRDLQGPQRRRRSLDMSVQDLNERRNSRQRRSQQTPPPPVHVQFQPKFDFRGLIGMQVATGIQSRLTHLLETRGTGSISVAVEGRTAILSGTVQSEYEQRLLEKLAGIEPGISRVDNRIVIGAVQLKPTR